MKRPEAWIQETLPGARWLGVGDFPGKALKQILARSGWRLLLGAGWGLGCAGEHRAAPASSPGQVLDQILVKSGYTLLGGSWLGPDHTE